MELFLMRHAEAENRDLYPDDRQRPLTARGREQQAHVVGVLAPLLQPLHYLLSSPLRRARQTADLVATAVSGGITVEETAVLAEQCTMGALLDLLQRYPPEARILCVGHEPHMSKLAAIFLDGAGYSTIAFQIGALLGLRFAGYPDPGQGTLRFFLRPAEVQLLFAVHGPV